MEQCHLTSAAGLEIIMYSFSLPEKIALKLGHWIMLNGLVNFRDIRAKLFSSLKYVSQRPAYTCTYSFSLNRCYFSQNSSVMNTKYFQKAYSASWYKAQSPKERKEGLVRKIMSSSDQVPVLASATECLCANLLPAHSSSFAGWALSHRLCLLTF